MYLQALSAGVDELLAECVRSWHTGTLEIRSMLVYTVYTCIYIYIHVVYVYVYIHTSICV